MTVTLTCMRWSPSTRCRCVGKHAAPIAGVLGRTSGGVVDTAILGSVHARDGPERHPVRSVRRSTSDATARHDRRRAASTSDEGDERMGEAIRIEDDGAVRHLVLCRPDEYNTITPALRDELDAALDDADARPRRAGRPPAGRGPGVLRGLRARLVDRVAQADERRRRGPGVGLGGRRPDDRPLRRHVRQAALDLEADDRRGAGLVHRRRHRHGPQRRPDRGGRSRPASATRRPGCGACPRRRGCGWPGSASSGRSATCFTGDELTGAGGRRRSG